MHVLITGGSGLIGTALTRDLLANQHTVTILSRTPSKIRPMDANHLTVEAWDGCTSHGWAHLLEETDAVVNLAGASIAGENLLQMRWTPTRKKAILESRLSAGNAVTAAIQASTKKPIVLIQASAVGFYGPLSDEMVTEVHPPGTDFLASVCRRWEDSSLPVETLGIRRVVIRTGIVLSNDNLAYKLLALPYRFFIGGPVGNGNQFLPWIHIFDHVSAIRRLIENPSASGAYNLVAPNPVTNNDFGRTLAKIIHRPHYLRVPSFVLKLILGEASTVALDGQRVIPERLLRMGFSYQYPTLETALQDLNQINWERSPK